MPEGKSKLPEDPSSDPGQLFFPSADSNLLNQIEVRLGNANSADEARGWAKIRGEIIQQNEFIKDGNQRRAVENTQVFFKLGLSLASITIGTVLILKGFVEQGLFILGVGLAPNLAKLILPSKGQGSENDSN
jgi:hypothetical protein